MDDSARVRVDEGIAHRDADEHDVVVRERAFAEQFVEGRPADELGDEVDGLVVATRLEQRHDRRVREPGRRQRLALGARRRTPGERDPLDGHRPVEALVVGHPDGPEAARAELFDQRVAAEHDRAGGRRITLGELHLGFAGSAPKVPLLPHLAGPAALNSNLQ